MKASIFLSALLLAGTAAFAVGTKPAATTSSKTVETTTKAQDSVAGSQTNSNLTGNVADDTSALKETPATTASGTTSGAIIDHTSKSKSKKMKSKTQPSSTQGVSPNDEVRSGTLGDPSTSSSSSGGGGGGM